MSDYWSSIFVWSPLQNWETVKKKGDSNKNKRRKKIAFAGMAVGESPLLGQVFLVLALIQIE